MQSTIDAGYVVLQGFCKILYHPQATASEDKARKIPMLAVTPQ